jgi:hypothetical protein
VGISSRACTVGAVVVYVLAYAGALGVLGRAPGFEAGESLAVLLIFGLGLSAAA